VATTEGDVKVRVLYFGIVRERLGKREETVEIPAGATVETLLNLLEQRYASMAAGAGSIRIACNNEYVDSDWTLSENDEIAVIPPVSGG
jgi:molybdopterin converting factor subunit 1